MLDVDGVLHFNIGWRWPDAWYVFVFYILTLGSLEETIAETQTVPENLPEVLNDFEEEEEVGHKLSIFGSG